MMADFNQVSTLRQIHEVGHAWDSVQDIGAYWSMMTSSNGNIFRVTGHLCGNSPVPGEFPAQRPVTRSFDGFFDLRLNNGWVNNREAGDLRRYRAHYDVIVMGYTGWYTADKFARIVLKSFKNDMRAVIRCWCIGLL